MNLPTKTLLGKLWLYSANRNGEKELAYALGKFMTAETAAVVARILAARGVAADELPSFYAPKVGKALPEPFGLPNLEKAVERLAAVVENGDKLGIISDWDVDGACAAALLGRFFRTIKVETELKIPDRLKDGFGPAASHIKQLAAAGVKTLITADCGTSAHLAIERAAALGIEVIVADHHLPDKQTPGAYALVNPQLLDDKVDGVGDLKGLCGTGVVFMLLVGLNRRLRKNGFYKDRLEPDLYALLDLVALATVCDMMPITPLNRVLIKCGFKVLDKWQNPGLRALAAAGELAVNQPCTERTMGFVLGPRLNAGGRVGNCSMAARLLTTDDEAEAAALAERLEELNRKRRAMETEAVLEANIQAENKTAATALVVNGDWHPGLVGLVAGRLARRWHKPTFAFARLRDGVAQGSARSEGTTDIGEIAAAALAAGLVLRAGGHAKAAGLTVRGAQLGALETFIRSRVKATKPTLTVDTVIDPSLMMSDGLVAALGQLAPYGADFAPPVFVLGGVSINGYKKLGEQVARVGLGHVDRKRAMAAVAYGEQLVTMLAKIADEATSYTVAVGIERSPYGTRAVIYDLARST